MHVSVFLSIEQFNSEARISIHKLLNNTLIRFSPNITQVSVLVVDENGPRGGIDKVCRVNLIMPGLGTVTATAKHEKLMAAVSEAARRARRMVLTKLKRRGTLRQRGCVRTRVVNERTTTTIEG